ncbi:hypothetical protein, partial [Porphyromonas loveana]|uniref:hypothetical protein n=1 Tax=Porphyromonas loveana TaxID=1884669 RepID=UPI0035A1B83F
SFSFRWIIVSEQRAQKPFFRSSSIDKELKNHFLRKKLSTRLQKIIFQPKNSRQDSKKSFFDQKTLDKAPKNHFLTLCR